MELYTTFDEETWMGNGGLMWFWYGKNWGDCFRVVGDATGAPKVGPTFERRTCGFSKACEIELVFTFPPLPVGPLLVFAFLSTLM